RRYTPAHAWIAKRLGELRVGLDDLALHVLHGVSKVELPMPGAKLVGGLPAVTIRCGERTVSIPAPVSGTVTAVNHDVADDPRLLDRSPYGVGWLYELKPESQAFRAFPGGASARGWFREERARLAR